MRTKPGLVSWMRRVVVLVLAVAAVVALIWWHREPDPLPTGPGDAPASAFHRAAVSGKASAPAGEPAATPSPSPSSPQGRTAVRGLAVAWLRGYLTRSSRDDDRWESAIADLSSPELVDELQGAGPDFVGLSGLRTWRVVKVEPVPGIDVPVDTPSRMTLSYAVSLTDGRRTVAKPFTVSCYRQADGRWLVGQVDQPYASEG